MGFSLSRHGFVGVIGPVNNPNYFTGCAYSAHLNEAKVFRTARGAMQAMSIWEKADYNERGPLPPSWWKERRASPVSLKIGEAF